MIFGERALHRPALKQWAFTEEIPQAAEPAVVLPSGMLGERRLHKPVLKCWEFTEDIPTAVPLDQQESFLVAAIGEDPAPDVFMADDEWVPAETPLGTDEEPWQVYTPAPLSKHPLYSFLYEDEIVTPSDPLLVDELYCAPPPIASVPPVVTLWQVEDESMDWFAEPPDPPDPPDPEGGSVPSGGGGGGGGGLGWFNTKRGKKRYHEFFDDIVDEVKREMAMEDTRALLADRRGETVKQIEDALEFMREERKRKRRKAAMYLLLDK
jgi:hypothetical protein